jgi:hypothetical protein
MGPLAEGCRGQVDVAVNSRGGLEPNALRVNWRRSGDFIRVHVPGRGRATRGPVPRSSTFVAARPPAPFAPASVLTAQRQDGDSVTGRTLTSSLTVGHG